MNQHKFNMICMLKYHLQIAFIKQSCTAVQDDIVWTLLITNSDQQIQISYEFLIM